MHERGRIMVGLAMAVMLAIGAAACGSSSKKSSSTTAAQPNSSKPMSSMPAASQPMKMGADVSVMHDAKYGDILVGPNGHTLYMYMEDKGMTSACGQDPCKGAWPGLAASSGKAKSGSGVDGSKLMTMMGQVPNQVSYNGHLLYYFSGDKSPGQVNGASVPNWGVVSPSGDMVGMH